VDAKLCLERPIWPRLPKKGVTQWWGQPIEKGTGGWYFIEGLEGGRRSVFIDNWKSDDCGKEISRDGIVCFGQKGIHSRKLCASFFHYFHRTSSIKLQKLSTHEISRAKHCLDGCLSSSFLVRSTDFLAITQPVCLFLPHLAHWFICSS